MSGVSGTETKFFIIDSLALQEPPEVIKIRYSPWPRRGKSCAAALIAAMMTPIAPAPARRKKHWVERRDWNQRKARRRRK